MPVPPILDVFVVWHPDDDFGSAVFDRLSAHFHSVSFSGLAGGAIEVYPRSASWNGSGPPRALGITQPLAAGLPSAEFNAVVPVLGLNLARAVRDDPEWRGYFEDIAALHEKGLAGVFPMRGGSQPSSGTLHDIVGHIQTLPDASLEFPGLLERSVAQAISQQIEGDQRIKVFVSHTKHQSPLESRRPGATMYELVRNGIAKSHLDEFFDAHDLHPGSNWAEELDRNAAGSALLVVRTDKYAGREWTQREVLTAKRHDLPIVGLIALSEGEERGSFLMDHIPTVPCNPEDPVSGVAKSLDRLVDECLKRALWNAQSRYLTEDGFDWLPVHSPEPVTLVAWLAGHQRHNQQDDHIWIIHPDPPLGPKEKEVAIELCGVAGFSKEVDIMTPRTFATSGGRLLS